MQLLNVYTYQISLLCDDNLTKPFRGFIYLFIWKCVIYITYLMVDYVVFRKYCESTYSDDLKCISCLAHF